VGIGKGAAVIHHLFARTIPGKYVLSDLIDLCPDGIIGINRQGLVTVFNPAAALMTRRSVASVLGKLPIQQIYGSLEAARRVKKAIYGKGHGGRGRLVGFETPICLPGGGAIAIRLSAVLIEKNGEEIGSIGFFQDLTGQKKLEEKLRLLSITDGLTGLFNQRHFHICLSNELARASRYHRPLSLICFDLDHFKSCNDSFGHLEGDNILRLASDLLRAATRRSDLNFRYGGDEFFVLLPETNLTEARTVAEKLRLRFNDRWPYDEVVDSDGVPMKRVTLSLGVVQRGDETEPDALVRRADQAMYAAKKRGGNQVVTDPFINP
jgi:diguanylate cyclase (GGDEF)-like protein/PAS domain S-box-containing protein